MFIDQDTQKRVNIYAPYAGRSKLDTPEIRAEVGVIEIADPVPPEDFSDETYYRTEQDDAPYVIFTRKSAEQLRQVELSKLTPLSPRQIRQALTAAGLRASVEAAVAAGDQNLKDWWEFATSFERMNPVVLGMATALNVTEQQMDDLWRLGASL